MIVQVVVVSREIVDEERERVTTAVIVGGRLEERDCTFRGLRDRSHLVRQRACRRKRVTVSAQQGKRRREGAHR